MSKRPVYLPKAGKPFYTTESYELDWASGQSAAQKTRNIQQLHEQFALAHPDTSILEVSTKSGVDAGVRLSPFHLSLRLPSLRRDFPVENIYQASKAFRHGGPYVDLLGTTPAAAKADPRLNDSGELAHFVLENEQYPAFPGFLFYCWIYLQALLAHPSLASTVKKTGAFTDIEFNPAKGKVNQAMACAMFHSLADLNLLDQARTFEGFKNIMLAQDLSEIKEQSGRPEEAPDLEAMRHTVRRTRFQVGDWLDHPSIGKGEVIRRTPSGYLISFRVSGPKTVSKDFVELHCKKLPGKPA